jgi:uncharacterized membrane protein
MRTPACSFLAATVAAVVVAPSHAGELFLLGLVPYSYAEQPSADGRVVAGYDGASAWYWTRETWVVRLDQSLPPGNGVGGHPNISADGRYITCSTLQGKPLKAEATIYDRELNTYDPAIGSFGFNCDIERCGPWGYTPSGSHVCGLMWVASCSALGFVWDSATDTIRTLPSLYFYKPTRANGISADGSFVGGWNDDYTGYRQGCVWKLDANGNYVGTLLHTGVPTIKLREVSCVSGNGQWAYGQGRTGIDGGVPYRWSYATGYQPITDGSGSVMAANHDGSMLLMGSGVWIAGRGIVPLRTWAAEHGFDLTTAWSFQPFGMTNDALTITGYAIRGTDLAWSPFVLDLHPTQQPCPADLDGNGEVGSPDIAMLLSQWGAVGGSADLNGDGTVGSQDIAVLLSAWGPCP